MQQISSPPAAFAEVQINENFETLQHQQVYGKRQPATTGLTWGFYGGRWGGASIADGTLALTNNSTNYVVVDNATGAISSSTTNSNWNDSTGYARVYLITTVGGVVTAVEDHRVGSRGALGGSGGGGGGLNYMAEALAVASPNNTVNAVSLTVTGGGANVDLVLVAKGTGAFMLDVPDNGTGGGNKRGAGAIDLQPTRGANTQVASGSSAVAVGHSNTASNINSIAVGNGNSVLGANGVAVGFTNTVSNSGAALGASNTLGPANSFVVGNGNSITTGAGAVAIGLSNTLTGSGALALGNGHTIAGVDGIAIGHDTNPGTSIGRMAFSSRSRSVVGDAQFNSLTLTRFTTNATATVLTVTNAAPAAGNQFQLINSSAHAFEGKVIARQNTTGDCKAWTFKGLIKRSGAGVVALVGTPTVTMEAEDAGATAWTLALSADDTLKSLAVTVTGEAAKTISWVAFVESVEVVG